MAVTVGATISVGEDDNVSSNPASALIAHTVDAGTGVLYVAVMVAAGNRAVSSVKWGGVSGVALTQLVDFNPALVNVGRITIFYLVNPALGAADISVVMAAGTGGNFAAVGVNLLGVDLAAPFGTPVTASVGGAGATSVTSPSMSGEFFIDALMQWSGGGNPSVAVGQTPLDGRGVGDSDETINGGATDCGVSSKAVSGPTTMGWTANTSYWAQIAVPVNAADVEVLAGSIDSTSVFTGTLTVILGPDSLVAIQKRGVMRSGIWVVGQSPPFPLIREIRTAVNVDRIKPLDEPGRLSFDISPREGEAPHDYATAGGSNLGDGLHLPPDLIREGTFLVDFSSELVEPWLWYIQTIAYDSDKASVQAVEVRGLLTERTLPEGSSFGSKGAAAVANVLLAQANGRNPTYIVPGSSSALRVVIPTGQATDFSRQNVLAAFDALAAFAAGDWWVAYAVSRSGIRPTLMLGKRGSDKRGEVVLTEGVELKAVSYARDAREVPRFVRFVQDSQGPAGGVATETPVGYRTGGQVQLAPEFHLRRALRKHGPALSAEQLRVYPQDTTDITLVGAALRSLQTSEAAVQTVELTLRQSPERFDVDGQPLANSQARTPWSAFGLGDTITVRLSSPQFFAGVDVVLRITALQPDEAAGEMILVGDIIE